MCVIFFYVNSNPKPDGFKLILASNRDEFYARETKAASKWNCSTPVYGGIDLKSGREGGTWLAISGSDSTIKAGALLNLTGEPYSQHAAVPCSSSPPSARRQYNNETVASTYCPINTPPNHSPVTNLNTHLHHNGNSLLGRGMIVTNYVKNFNDANNNKDYNKTLVEDCAKYNAFNFVSLEIGPTAPASITVCSNVPPGLVHYKENTCYGFGNSLPDVPFEKIRNGRDRFQCIVENYLENNERTDDNLALVTQLMELLKSKQKFWPDAELKRRAPNFGEYLSALNVNIPHEDYGSRTHTVILVDSRNKMHFIEETMLTDDPKDEWSHTHLVEQFI